MRFRLTRYPNVNTTPENAASSNPAISILKPLKGMDSETEKCLKSWLEQEYPGEAEIFFGLASVNDPARRLVEKLLAEKSKIPAQFVLCDPILGSNAKVSSLCHMMKQAGGEIIIVSDDDVLIPPRFLENLVRHFHKSREIGLVNCFYFLKPKNWAMQFEAIAVNADFWTQVLQGLMLKPMDFALGAVMATRREALEKIGGFEYLLEYLADDYQLGNQIARSGAKLQLASIPVECRSEPLSARQVWNHQLRWARTIRVCQPVPYFFSIISNPTLWTLAAMVSGAPGAKWLFALTMLARTGMAAFSYQKLSGMPGLLAGLLAPIKDLLAAIIWLLSFTGNKISWRGTLFRVNRGGKLTPIA
jgi:ceramide glucosyltransferase